MFLAGSVSAVGTNQNPVSPKFVGSAGRFGPVAVGVVVRCALPAAGVCPAAGAARSAARSNPHESVRTSFLTFIRSKVVIVAVALIKLLDAAWLNAGNMSRSGGEF